MSTQRPVVVVGSINTDLVTITARIPAVGETVFGTDFQSYPGGKGANQAVAVARLGYPVRLIGRLGSDAFGASLRTHLDRAGVDTAGVAVSDGVSGVAVIVVSHSGENSIVVTPGANSLVTPNDIDTNIEIIRGAGIVLAQLEIPIETIEYLSKVCAREDLPLILDPAPASLLPPAVFSNTAWFTPNQTEAAFFAEDQRNGKPQLSGAELVDQLRSRGCRGIVLKMGGEGIYLAPQIGQADLIPAIAVEAVDTTAAGDAFNGGFATGLMLGKTPLESARFAVAVAGISVTRQGAQPSMPSRNEVEELLKAAAR